MAKKIEETIGGVTKNTRQVVATVGGVVRTVKRGVTCIGGVIREFWAGGTAFTSRHLDGIHDYVSGSTTKYILLSPIDEEDSTCNIFVYGDLAGREYAINGAADVRYMRIFAVDANNHAIGSALGTFPRTGVRSTISGTFPDNTAGIAFEQSGKYSDDMEDYASGRIYSIVVDGEERLDEWMSLI